MFSHPFPLVNSTTFRHLLQYGHLCTSSICFFDKIPLCISWKIKLYNILYLFLYNSENGNCDADRIIYTNFLTLALTGNNSARKMFGPKRLLLRMCNTPSHFPYLQWTDADGLIIASVSCPYNCEGHPTDPRPFSFSFFSTVLTLFTKNEKLVWMLYTCEL